MLDARVTDADAKSHCKRAPAKVLESQEKEKKCLEARLERCRHFTPFVCSVDGLLGTEAQTFAKRPTTSAWACQCLTEHRHSLRHAPARERKPSPSARNQRPLSSMGGRSWSVAV